MFGGLYVSGVLGELLREYLDAEGLSLPAVRQRLASWSPDSRIPLADWIRLLQDISLAEARPALGLDIGRRATPRHAGVLGYLSLSCDTLGEAVLRFNRYHRLVYDGNPVQVDLEPDIVTISWGIEHGRPGQLADETAISIFATLVRLLTDKPLQATSVNFVNPAPADTSPYVAFFGCEVSFENPRTSVTFPASYLLLPLRNSDPGLRALLDQQAETLLQGLPEDSGFEADLNLALVRTLHNGEPTLENVASRLAMSTRTLQRRLAQHDLNFQSLLDRTRSRLAEDYLANPALSLAEIALLLGYSEQSAFNRAFRRWKAESPRRYRQTLLTAPTTNRPRS